MKLIRFLNRFNIKKEAEDLGVSIWQTPSFLFLALGIFIIMIMVIVYFISQFGYSPEFLVIAESIVVVVIFSIGNFIIHGIENIAKANKMKSEFVTIASHQLKTPLSQINWELEILLSKNKEGLSEKQLEIIKTISQSHETMKRLVNDLLDVTRIDQKRLILRKEAVDIVSITERMVEDFTSLARSRNIIIELNANKKRIPKITGDPERTKLVVENLLNNAIKYVVKRGRIEIKIVRRDNTVVFSIRDNGVGIPEEQQGQVFEKFFRSDNVVKYQTEGTGLGLYISKNIIEQTGGKIWFQSIENVGSVFNFSLPVK
jgi:signal transduction histidine kinase